VALLVGVSTGATHPSAAPAFIPVGHNMTLVPVPEIITDPNEGETVGVLGTLLMTDDNGNIVRMIAPDVRYNNITGVYPSFRLFDYSQPKQRLFLQAGKATRTGEYFEATYAGDEVWNGWLDVRGRVFKENDPFERFYGFGNNTPNSAETNYLSDSTVVLGSALVNVTEAWHGGMQARVRVVRVHHGGIDSIEQLVDDPQLQDTPGVDGATIIGPRFTVRYDTRDDSMMTTEGHLADAGFEVIDTALGASASYLRYSLEERSFIPLRPDKRFIVATQAVLEYMQGGNRAPFYERSSLGGIHSLRGFGSNRYIDNDRFFTRGELRWAAWTPQWLTAQFQVKGHLEIAPFFETGRVFDSSRTFPLETLHFAGGSGFRAVIPPQLVAYVDVGTTGSGVAVFTGVDYPF
jgi:outer membrane protein assembly factor BamA